MILALAVFWPALSRHPLPDIDYALVIDPLRSVHSIEDYLKTFLSRTLFDVQPVRDLSLLLDLWIEGLIGHQVFGFFNLAIWTGTIIFFERLLRLVSVPLDRARAMALLVLLHPLVAWVVTWPTARKHLLAALFLMIASWLAVRYKRGEDRLALPILIAYSLSVLSQPIGLLWAFVFLLYLGSDLRLRKHWPLAVLFLLVFTGVTVVNFIYYAKIYPTLIGADKTTVEGARTLGLKILSLSRSFAQIFLPAHFASEYSPLSILGLLGLPLSAILLWLLTFRIHWKTILFVLLFALHPLLLINFRSTNIFLSDTYLLLPLLGIGLLLAFAKPSINLLLLVALIAAGKTTYEVTLASEQTSYFRAGFEREGNCRNALAYANYLLQVADLEKFYDVAGDTMANNCLFGGKDPVIIMGQTYAFRIFMDKRLSFEEKEKLMAKVKVSPAVQYLSVLLFIQAGAREKARLEMKKLQPLPNFLRPALTKLHQAHCGKDKLCEKLRL